MGGARKLAAVLGFLATVGAASTASAGVGDVPLDDLGDTTAQLRLELVQGPSAPERTWDPVAFRDQLIRLLPSRTLEDIAQTFARRNVELEVRQDKAFLLVRIPL